MKIQNLSVGENLRLVGWWRSNSFHLQTLRLQLFFTAWLKETFENTSHWVAIVYVRYHKIWETSCKRLYNKKRKRLKSPMDFQHHFPLQREDMDLMWPRTLIRSSPMTFIEKGQRSIVLKDLRDLDSCSSISFCLGPMASKGCWIECKYAFTNFKFRQFYKMKFTTH